MSAGKPTTNKATNHSSAAESSAAHDQPLPAQSLRERLGRPFWIGLLGVVLTLLLASGIVGWQLRSRSPLSLLSGTSHPVAGASVYIPARSPLTLSLLTRPDRLVTLQQAIATDSVKRQQIQTAAEQLKSSLFTTLGLDYDSDLAPWIGEEITFAYTAQDLDRDDENGQQPGYLLALEIAPDKQLEAQLFLQRLWQVRILSGAIPQRQRQNGVMVFSTPPESTSRHPAEFLTAASALINQRYILLANDAQVINRALQSAQTGDNLAQNRPYRSGLEQLPPERIGLGYIALAQRHWSLSLQLASQGLQLTAIPNGPLYTEASLQTRKPVSALGWLPQQSDFAIGARTALPALLQTLNQTDVSRSGDDDAIPDFLQLGESISDDADREPNSDESDTRVSEKRELWDWPNADYALGRVGSGARADWILAIRRQAEKVQETDEAAQVAGYSVVPVDMGNAIATGWTQLTAAPSRRSGGAVETSLLALHLQQDNYELYSNSIAGLRAAISAPDQSLLDSKAFQQAIAPLSTSTWGHLYGQWSAIAPILFQQWPELKPVLSAMQPVVARLGAIAATIEPTQIEATVQMQATSPAPSRTTPSRSNASYRPPTAASRAFNGR